MKLKKEDLCILLSKKIEDIIDHFEEDLEYTSKDIDGEIDSVIEVLAELKDVE